MEFDLYLSLCRYKAATLISYTDVYRKAEMGKYGNVKYKDIYFYGMNPYFGKITRKEFLILMYTLLSNDSSMQDDSIISTFNTSGVLLGYDNDLWLNERITYAEMFTFLYRFEAFDFETGEMITGSSDESSTSTKINGESVDMSDEDAMKLFATILNLSLNADQYTEEEMTKQLMNVVEKYTD